MPIGEELPIQEKFEESFPIEESCSSEIEDSGDSVMDNAKRSDPQ